MVWSLSFQGLNYFTLVLMPCWLCVCLFAFPPGAFLLSLRISFFVPESNTWHRKEFSDMLKKTLRKQNKAFFYQCEMVELLTKGVTFDNFYASI